MEESCTNSSKREKKKKTQPILLGSCHSHLFSPYVASLFVFTPPFSCPSLPLSTRKWPHSPAKSPGKHCELHRQDLGRAQVTKAFWYIFFRENVCLQWFWFILWTENVHQNQNGQQFRLFSYVRRPIDTLGAGVTCTCRKGLLQVMSLPPGPSPGPP